MLFGFKCVIRHLISLTCCLDSIEVSHPTVIQLLHVWRDWGEFTFILWKSLLWILALSLFKDNTFNFSLLNNFSLILWLVAVLVKTVCSVVHLIILSVKESRSVDELISDIRVIMLLTSQLLHVVDHYVMIFDIFCWSHLGCISFIKWLGMNYFVIFLLNWSIEDSSVTRSHLTSKVYKGWLSLAERISVVKYRILMV